MASSHPRPSRKRTISDDDFAGPSSKQRKASTTPVRTPGEGKVIWSRDMRRFLLEIRAQCVPATALRLFKQKFEDDLKAYGVWDTIKWRTLYAQYREKEKRKNADWNAIAAADAQELELQRLVAIEVQEMLTGTADESFTSVPRQIPVAPDTNKIGSATVQLDSSRAPATPSRVAVVSLTAIKERPSRSSGPVPRTPLSQQAPIAYHDDHNEENTIAAGSANLSKFAFVTPPKTPRCSLAVTTSIRRSEPITPSRKARQKQAASSSLVPLHRPGDGDRGFTLMESPAKHAEAAGPSGPVVEPHAHPPPGALLFRFFDPETQGEFSAPEGGFVARLYADHNFEREMPPSWENPPWAQIRNHVHGKKQKGPFISVSSSLWWVLRRALRAMSKSGIKTYHVAVIASDCLDPKAIFHLPPYIVELKRRYAFEGGEYRSGGGAEYLIWQEIPAHAVFYTFKLADLVQFENRNPAIKSLLNLNILAATGGRPSNLSTKAKHLKRLDAHGIQHRLTPESVSSIAHFANYIGIDSNAKLEHISCIVEEVVQGWGFQQERCDWPTLASIFASTLIGLRDPLAPRRSELELEYAFHEGVTYACVSTNDVNIRHKPLLLCRAWKRASKIGLGTAIVRNRAVVAFEDRMKFVMDSIQASQNTIQTSIEKQDRHQNRRKALLERYALQPLEAPPAFGNEPGYLSDYDDRVGTRAESHRHRDSQLASRNATLRLASVLEQDVAQDEDYAGSSDDEGNSMIFEMDETGMVMG